MEVPGLPRSWMGAWRYTERRKEPSGLALSSSRASFGQIILALGNYMNSSKRGAVYGFKLQSLDLVRWWGQQVARKLDGAAAVAPGCSALLH